MGFICIFFIVLIAFFVISTIVQCILKKSVAAGLIGLDVMLIVAVFPMLITSSYVISDNAEYIIEDKKYEVEKINKSTICLDGKEYEYSFEYDSNAEISYAKKIKYQYTKAEKFLFGNLLTKYAAIIYTNDMSLIQSH